MLRDVILRPRWRRSRPRSPLYLK